MNNKVLFIIMATLIVLVGGGTYFYLFLYKPLAPAPTTPTLNPTQGFNPLNPSGNQSSYYNWKNISTSTISTSTEVTKLPKLRLISADPVSGSTASTTGSTTVIRYMDRGLGHIYETTTSGTDVTTISKRTIPQTYESIWSLNSDALIIRNLPTDSSSEDIQTRVVSISDPKPIVPSKAPVKTSTSTIATSTATSTTLTDATTTPEKIIKISYVMPKVKSITPSPKDLKDKVFALLVEKDTGSSVYLFYPNTDKIVQIFNSPFKSWNISWPVKNKIILATKGSGYSTGYVYSYDTDKKEMTRLFSSIGMYAVPNPGLTKIAFSFTPQGKSEVWIYDVKTGTSKKTIFNTLADKCTWGVKDNVTLYCAVPLSIPNDVLPDAWYKGKVSFMDKIWRLNTDTGQVFEVGDLYELSNKKIDAMNLYVDPKENYVIFMNKEDLSLWSLEII